MMVPGMEMLAAAGAAPGVPTQWVVLGLVLSFAGPVIVAWVTGKFNRQASRDATTVQSRQVDIEEWEKLLRLRDEDIERRDKEIERRDKEIARLEAQMQTALERIGELETKVRDQRAEAHAQEDRHREVAQDHVAWDHLAVTEIRRLGGTLVDPPPLTIPRLAPDS